MKVFDSYNSLQSSINNGEFRFLPDYGPAGFRCSQCHIVSPLNTSGSGASTGYAVTRDNEFLCYPCADTNQRKSLITGRNGPIYAYVNQNASHVTTWSGGKLGSIVGYGESAAGWAGSTIARFRVRDVHGQWWQGRGAGRGMACTLRPMKEPRA